MKEIPRILIVDDERFHLNVIVDLLGEDYQVAVAKSGERALEIACSENTPDLILLDILMPGMNGYEVCQKLKSYDNTKSIPIIFLTIKSDVADETYGLGLGAVDYITKPISPPIVKARVRTHLALSQASCDLANQNEQLEFKIHERTREIILIQQETERLQMQLQQAQKMEAIGHLSGGIAHDFNNILSTIIGFADLSLLSITSKEYDELSENLQHIRDAGGRAKDLVEQLLAFSRGVPSSAQPLKLAEQVNEVHDMLRPILPTTIEFKTELDDKAPLVMFDKIQIQQLVMNLCINARDAMDGEGLLSITLNFRQGVAIECSACHAPVIGDFVELAVADNGSGINADLLGKVFQPFFTTKEVGKGSGMGLSVVNNIAHKHQGHVAIETSEGEGTTFRLFFPPVQAAESEAQRSGFHDKEIVYSTAAGEHILLVDDDMSVTIFLKEILELSGYHVTVFNDSLQALEAIIAEPAVFDLIITDQTMPGMTGEALAKTIYEKNFDIPVILCPACETTKISQGVAKVLTKPIQSGILIQTIQVLLSFNKTDNTTK